MKPLIGITAETIRDQHQSEYQSYYGQKISYIDAVRQAGGVPMIIPTASSVDDVRDVFYQLDGILFAGGDDISPRQYGEQSRYAYGVDEARDWHELTLMEMALRNRMPILAICRGMQLLNVKLGGTLYQDIAREVPGAIDHDGHNLQAGIGHLSHELRIEHQSELARILGKTSIMANSFHHQAIKDVGEDLVVSARTSDGIIEAVEGSGAGYLIGVQSHPERIVKNETSRWTRLFRSFVEATTD